MTALPIHRTAPADPEAVTTAILRVLRDADAPVPVRDLDATSADRRAVSAALTRLARGGLIDIAAGHVSISPAHLRREPEKAETPEPTPTPAPTHQPPKSAPSTRAVLTLITTTLTEHGPMTPTQLTDRLPRAAHAQIPAALTLGTASGVLGRRNNRLFAVVGPTTPRQRVRRRGGAR